jgi:micrococcal nuclease
MNSTLLTTAMLLATTMTALADVPRAFTISGTVAEVEDGDTITLRASNGAQFQIRMSDYDTPEISHEAFTLRGCNCKPIPYRPGQPGGKAARQVLVGLLPIGSVVEARCYESDTFGRRLVCHVDRDDGTHINLEMIRSGWGWLPDRSEWVRHSRSADAEKEARARRAGAWVLLGKVSPREWRQACWHRGQCPGAER